MAKPAPADPTPDSVAKAPRRGRIRLGIALTVAVILVTLGIYYWTTPSEDPSANRLKEALQLLKAGEAQQARDLALQLEAEGYQDPEFPAGIGYLLGTVAFQDAEDGEVANYRPQALTALGYLGDVERQELDPDTKRQVSYMLGRIYCRLRLYREALPRLEDCLEQPELPQILIQEMLAEITLSPNHRTEARLKSALGWNTAATAAQKDPADRQRLQIQRFRLLVAAKDFPAADTLLANLHIGPQQPGLQEVLTALLRSAQKDYAGTRKVLEPLVQNDRLKIAPVQIALLLMGMSYDQESEAVQAKDPDAAMELRHLANSWYQKTIDRFDRTEEGTAARLFAGRLWQFDESSEKALQSYAAVLRNVNQPEEFENPWFGLDEFRQRILDAWNSWIRTKHYAESIAISKLMTPLFSRERSDELSAMAHLRWAEALETELATASQSLLKQRAAERRIRWREAGDAYARLAEVRKNLPGHSEALRLSAEQYYRGQAFDKALQQLDEFLKTGPDSMVATILVQRANLLLDLDRVDEAIQNLTEVLEKYPTDPAVFAAQSQLGSCYFEKNELNLAERAWRSVVQSNALTPSALEWRESLFALGKLLFEKGTLHRRHAERTQPVADAPPPAESWRLAGVAWEEAAQLLDEYEVRYPNSLEIAEARFTLARTRQELGSLMTWQHSVAETDNRRQQLLKDRLQVLGLAYQGFAQLTEALQVASQQDRLDETQQSLLKSCIFESAHTLYKLGRYDEAIVAYTTAVNRFPQDAQVLTAYLQMARCYSHLGKPAESRSLLEQARVILQQDQIPATAFVEPSSSLSRTEWEAWLDRAAQIQP